MFSFHLLTLPLALLSRPESKIKYLSSRWHYKLQAKISGHSVSKSNAFQSFQFIIIWYPLWKQNRTSASIGARKWNFLSFEKITTDRTTDQQTNRPTYRPGREISLPILIMTLVIWTFQFIFVKLKRDLSSFSFLLPKSRNEAQNYANILEVSSWSNGIFEHSICLL